MGDRTMRLTEKELKLMQLVADGLSTKDAAVELGVSYQNLKNKSRRIYNKIGADNRAHAVAQLMRRGIIT